MKNISNRYEINRLRPRHEHKYAKYKMSLNMMVLCVKQQLSKISGSTHEIVKQHWGWVEKNVVYKKACTLQYRIIGD